MYRTVWEMVNSSNGQLITAIFLRRVDRTFLTSWLQTWNG